MARTIVDGMNVIGARPDGWWRDRPAALTRLVESLVTWARATATPVVAVLDGHPPPGLAAGLHEGIELMFSGRGVSADDVIARMVEEHPDPASLTVVTSDAELARRVRAAGAGRLVGAGAFRTDIERR